MNRRSFINRAAAFVVICPALRWVPMSSELDFLKPCSFDVAIAAVVETFSRYWLMPPHTITVA